MRLNKILAVVLLGVMTFTNFAFIPSLNNMNNIENSEITNLSDIQDLINDEEIGLLMLEPNQCWGTQCKNCIKKHFSKLPVVRE